MSKNKSQAPGGSPDDQEPKPQSDEQKDAKAGIAGGDRPQTSAAGDPQTGTDVQTGTPNSPNPPETIGTGAPVAAGTSIDPNIDIAREQARDVHARKQAAGEDAGEAPPEPQSLAAKATAAPTGPVANGFRRVKVVSPIQVGHKIYEAGRIADIPITEADSLGDNVEAVDAG
jgi:hypothetical protein